jgi:hypothetical protein
MRVPFGTMEYLIYRTCQRHVLAENVFFLPFGVRYFGLEFRRIKYENMSSHRNLFLLFFFKDAHQVWLRCTCAVILCN